MFIMIDKIYEINKPIFRGLFWEIVICLNENYDAV
jgi:hypothetical protein